MAGRAWRGHSGPFGRLYAAAAWGCMMDWNRGEDPAGAPAPALTPESQRRARPSPWHPGALSCLGADHTKEFLSFGRQPSFFKGPKPIVVSPFENPFPTRGCGPWTPRGAADSRWFLRIPSTGRDAPTAQLLGVETLLSSYHFLRADRKTAHQTAAIPAWRSLQSPCGLRRMTVRVSRRDSKVRQCWQDGRDTIKSRGRGALPCLSSRASKASRGISNPESQPPPKTKPCLVPKT